MNILEKFSFQDYKDVTSEDVQMSNTKGGPCMNLGGKARGSRYPEQKTTGETHSMFEAQGCGAGDDSPVRQLQDAQGIPVKQPHSAVPHSTKINVQRQLRRVAAEGKLNHNPGSAVEWQLVKWHLSHELKLSPLRIVFLFSEISASGSAAKP